MATNAAIRATAREAGGKGAARKLRREGKVPAVIYGHGEETRSLAVDAHELEVLFSRISVENTVIDISIDGGRKKAAPVRALVREVQRHPYRPEILHVDFYQLHAGEKVDVEVPIRLVGTAAGVKVGGVLQHSLHDLEIRCLAEAIPSHIDVDISALEIGDSVHVREIAVPEGVEVETDPERTVCAVIPPTVAPVEEPAAEVVEGVAGEVEPELVRKRPVEEAEEEAAE
jgi:large subunit ribosomal protein L25